MEYVIEFRIKYLIIGGQDIDCEELLKENEKLKKENEELKLLMELIFKKCERIEEMIVRLQEKYNF